MPSKQHHVLSTNIFLSDSGDSNHLGLKNIKRPAFKEERVEHKAGGSLLGLNMGMGSFEPLELGFNLMGENMEALKQIGLRAAGRKNYTIREHIRDLESGREFASTSVVSGRLLTVEPDQFEKGSLKGCEYMVGEIISYRYVYDGIEKIDFDFFSSIYRVDGVDINAAANAALGI